MSLFSSCAPDFSFEKGCTGTSLVVSIADPTNGVRSLIAKDRSMWKHSFARMLVLSGRWLPVSPEVQHVFEAPSALRSQPQSIISIL